MRKLIFRATITMVVLFFIAMSVLLFCTIHVLKTEWGTFYMPGRDTVKYWGDGKCEIVGLGGSDDVVYYLDFNNVTIAGFDNEVVGYRQIDQVIFILTKNGGIVVNLDTDEYVIYDSSEIIDSEYHEFFANEDEFVFLK